MFYQVPGNIAVNLSQAHRICVIPYTRDKTSRIEAQFSDEDAVEILFVGTDDECQAEYDAICFSIMKGHNIVHSSRMVSK